MISLGWKSHALILLDFGRPFSFGKRGELVDKIVEIIKCPGPTLAISLPCGAFRLTFDELLLPGCCD